MRNTLDPGLATSYHIDLSKNFYTLNTAEVAQVLYVADLVKYRKPTQANGSRARYFFAYLQRAQRKAS